MRKSNQPTVAAEAFTVLELQSAPPAKVCSRGATRNLSLGLSLTASETPSGHSEAFTGLAYRP